MKLNADFAERVVVRPDDYRWVDSPVPGVERMMLDRIGDEVARATSLVRYAPNSTFSAHVHAGGEEYLVLEGEFGDEHGRYPAGYYVRNPVGTSHAPRVAERGCTIFVKLRQFDEDDQRQCVIDTRSTGWSAGPDAGMEVLPLHEFGAESVEIWRMAPWSRAAERTYDGGAEILVIEGKLLDDYGEYPAGSWIRNPRDSRLSPSTGDAGAVVYVKTGHLP